MMLDRIGTIGNTHGVNARPSPAAKNIASESQQVAAREKSGQMLFFGLAPLALPLSGARFGAVPAAAAIDCAGKRHVLAFAADSTGRDRRSPDT